ncbi:MAG TPA: DedA family protein [Dissulfurispiraceae bacterium]|nr:DedA family protein [Dissulfurispiraceae bacterium]
MDTSVIQNFPYLGLLVLLVLGTLGFPFPEDAILILCGFMIAHDVVEPVPAILILFAGMLCTDFFLYHVGRKYGRMVVAHKRFRRIISPRRIRKLSRSFEKWGIFVIFFGRHLVGLRAQIFLVAGILKMPRPKFILADALSSMITIALMVGAGYWGGNFIEMIKTDAAAAQNAMLILALIGLICILIWRVAVRRLRDNDSPD